MFVPVASALIGTHRGCLYLASFSQQPEIQSLVCQGQINSTDPLLLTDGQTDTQLLSQYNDTVVNLILCMLKK